MIRKITSICFFVSLFCGCLPSSRINIKGRYFADIGDGGRYLGYQTAREGLDIGLVENVFAAGYCEKFIVAIKHPYRLHGVSVDSNYYIIPFHKEYTMSPQDGTIGPFTPQEFELKKAQLGIGQVIWKKLN
jgi:hypothetical protein